MKIDIYSVNDLATPETPFKNEWAYRLIRVLKWLYGSLLKTLILSNVLVGLVGLKRVRLHSLCDQNRFH